MITTWCHAHNIFGLLEGFCFSNRYYSNLAELAQPALIETLKLSMPERCGSLVSLKPPSKTAISLKIVRSSTAVLSSSITLCLMLIRL